MKQSLFKWQGITYQGENIQGELIAKNLIMAKAELRSQAIVIRRIKKINMIELYWRKQIQNKRITLKEQATLSRQLATLIKAGIPLLQSLTILLKQEKKPHLHEKIGKIKHRIEAGNAFHAALREFPHDFDLLYCNMIEAGEQSGTLDTILLRIADYRESMLTLRRKIKKALSYPIIVMLVALCVTLILLIKVIPEFQILFANNNAPLPVFTAFIIHVSTSLREYGLIYFILLVGLFLTIVISKRKSNKMRQLYEKILLHSPGVGPLLKKACTARIMRTLSTLLKAGLPLINALTLAGKISGYSRYEHAMIEAANHIHRGEALHKALSSDNYFSPYMIEMIAVGEETGELETMLMKITEINEADVMLMVDMLGQWLEPLIMSFLGIVIGGLIIAMYLPIFNLGHVIS